MADDGRTGGDGQANSRQRLNRPRLGIGAADAVTAWCRAEVASCRVPVACFGVIYHGRRPVAESGAGSASDWSREEGHGRRPGSLRRPADTCNMGVRERESCRPGETPFCWRPVRLVTSQPDGSPSCRARSQPLQRVVCITGRLRQTLSNRDHRL